MRIVLDTCVLVSSIRSRNSASKAELKAGLQARFDMLISVPLVLEYEAVLSRRVHLAESNLTADEVAELVDGICSVGIHIDMKRSWRPQSPDPNDEMVLETAINGNAEAIVTFNRRDFEESCRRFNIRLLSPQDVLRSLESR